MDKNTQELYLDIQDNKTYEQLYAKQYCAGSEIIFHITKNGKPFDVSDMTAAFQMKKTDQTVILNSCTVEGNTVSIRITEQMTACYGKAPFQITLTKDETVITTITGIMKIDESVVHPEDIESSDEFNIITDILRKAEDADKAAKNAKLSEENAKTSENHACDASISAEHNAQEAENSASLTKQYAANASDSADIASAKAAEALESATEAKKSEINAKSSEALALTKSDEALHYSILARSYTVGGTNTRDHEDVDNSKYYYEQAKQISQGLNGALLPMGTVTFSSLSSQTKKPGYMYNISDSFTTDDTFKEGSGYTYPAGTNVYYTIDGYWDCLAGIMVTGIKGNAEESYRTGDINLTPEDIGIKYNDENGLSVETKDSTVDFESMDTLTPTEWTDLPLLGSGEKHSSLFNKISVMFRNIRYLFGMSGNLTSDLKKLQTYSHFYNSYTTSNTPGQWTTINNVGFLIPCNGIYRITSTFRFGSVSSGAGNLATCRLLINDEELNMHSRQSTPIQNGISSFCTMVQFADLKSSDNTSFKVQVLTKDVTIDTIGECDTFLELIQIKK